MATEPKKPASSSRGSGKTARGASPRAGATTADAKPAVAKIPEPPAPDQKAADGRISALEAGLKSAEARLAERTAALERRLAAVESGQAPGQKVNLPAGVPESVRQGIDRAADLVRHNPITALILIVAFLLVAIFS